MVSIGLALSEEKIFEKVYDVRRTPSDGNSSPDPLGELKMTQGNQISVVFFFCLLMDRDEMCNLYRGPSIDASYLVSVHLAKGFQRRIKCEKLTTDD